MENIKKLFISKKFWVTVLGLVILGAIEIFTDKLPIEAFCTLFSVLIGAYTVAQGISDAKNGNDKKKD